jgi:hypothetical protein
MMADATPLTSAERRLAWLLRILALLFVGGAVGFLLRPEEMIHHLGVPGTFIGLPSLATTGMAVESDFWFALAVANMAANAACCWLAASNIRVRRALVYPVVVSMLVASGTAALVFVRWAPAFPFLALVLVALPVALILLRALGRARMA